MSTIASKVSDIDIRDAFFDAVYRCASGDREVLFLTADMSAMSLERFKELPSQYINMGIAEQNMVSVAAGLAMSGKKVFIYAIAPFVTLRCYEQIKVDLSNMGLPVVVVGVGPGISYGSDGATHHATQDIAVMRALPNFEIYSPCDARMAGAVAELCYRSAKPSYVRLDKGRWPDIYTAKERGTRGFSLVKAGKDILIISTGVMVHRSIELATELLTSGIDAAVLDLYRIKPVNRVLLIAMLKKFSRVVTIEEHSIIGGIGSLISEFVTDESLPVSLKRFALGDRYCPRYGSREWMQAYYGLDVRSLRTAIQRWVG